MVMPHMHSDLTAKVKCAVVGRLADASEFSLLRKLAPYPRMVEAAAAAHEPHRVAFYLY